MIREPEKAVPEGLSSTADLDAVQLETRFTDSGAVHPASNLSDARCVLRRDPQARGPR